MLTTMTDEDLAIVLQVFAASHSRRGDKGRDDRKFLEALQYFVVHNITWRALPEKFGHWNSVWKRFWRLSRSGTFEAFFDALAAMSETAHSIPPWCARMCRRRAQKGARRSSTRPLARRLLDENPPEGRSRRLAAGLSSHRRRSQRQSHLRGPARPRPQHHAARRHYRQGIRCQGQPRWRPPTRHLSDHPVQIKRSQPAGVLSE